MQLTPTAADTSWFFRSAPDPVLGASLSAFTEPHLNDFFRANFYHLKGRDIDLVVDTGMGLSPLRPILDLVAGKPVLAVATHIHADHVGSLFEFADRAGPKWEAQAFRTMNDRDTFAGEFRAMEQPVTRLPHPGWSVQDYTIRPAPLTRILDEGDRIELGDRSLTVLHLPGHSFGGIGLYDERDGLLFSGDAVYEGYLLDDMWCSDKEQYRATMRRLIDLPVRIVHAGHGASFGQTRLKKIARDYLDRT